MKGLKRAGIVSELSAASRSSDRLILVSCQFPPLIKFPLEMACLSAHVV